MRINLIITFSIVLAIGLVVLGFTVFQVYVERNRLLNDIEKRSLLFSEDFYKKNEANIIKGRRDFIKRSADSARKSNRLLGIAIYYSRDSIVPLNASVRPFLHKADEYVSQLISTDSTSGNYFKINGQHIYQYVKPVKLNALSEAAIIFYLDANYIHVAIRNIWLRNFIQWFIQALLLAWATIVLLRWGIFTLVNKIADWIKAARHGNFESLDKRLLTRFLAPLHKEINQMAQAMNEARATAEEEARLRATAESIWTPERLKEEVKRLLRDKALIVVSNREPYMHVHSGKEIKCVVPASGLVTAMEPILKACGGLWVASGTGDADKETVDKENKVQVPPEDPKYTLQRLWLTREDEEHFYYGFSNEGLWPLCHIAHTRPVFRKDDWQFYQKVNHMYAKTVVKEIKGEEQPLILVQDYHFALLPGMIKKERPDAKIALFWHIPWPNPESFGICPWQQEILKGMLGADLIGFHTQYHCNNFLETVNNSLESRVMWENFSVKIADQTTLVKPFPISIAFTLKDFDQNGEARPSAAELLKAYGLKTKLMGIGVDRIDYTKGIIERFLAVERFLEKYPSYQGEFTFVQIGAPSRTLIKSYSDMVTAIENEANRINARFKSKDWRPILLLKTHHSHEEIMPFYKSSDLCMVTSLHDGMNLVAKEYVASRNTVDGVLILSRFAGASQELQDALIVNPYDIEDTADSIKAGLEMSKEEQHRRMTQMRRVITGHNIYSWAASLIRTLATINN
ncbi:MAG TPA: trehalose-6-phosphate synthase [Bacteroidales bacterium]